MDRRTLSAVVICLVIFLTWQKLYVDKVAPNTDTKAATAQTAQVVPPTVTAADASSASPPAAIQPVGADQPVRGLMTLVLTASTGDAVLGDGANVLSGWDLRHFRQNLPAEKGAVNLGSVTHTEGELQVGFDAPALAYLNSVQGALTPA